MKPNDLNHFFDNMNPGEDIENHIMTNILSKSTKKHRNKRAAFLTVGAAIAICAAVSIVILLKIPGPPIPPVKPNLVSGTNNTITLYVLDSQNRLLKETIQIDMASAEILFEQLIQKEVIYNKTTLIGFRAEDSTKTVSEESVLKGIRGKRTGYLDFSPDFAERMQTDKLGDLRLAAIANSYLDTFHLDAIKITSGTKPIQTVSILYTDPITKDSILSMTDITVTASTNFTATTPKTTATQLVTANPSTPYNPGVLESPDWNNEREVCFTVVDTAQQPISNLVVSLRYISGSRDGYEMQSAFLRTNERGEASFPLISSTYEITMSNEKKDLQGNITVYETHKQTVQIKDETRSIQLTWAGLSPVQRTIKTAENCIFKITENGKPLSGAYVQVYAGKHDLLSPHTDEKRGEKTMTSVDIGYTDKDGKIAWIPNYEGDITLSIISADEQSGRKQAYITLSNGTGQYEVIIS